MLPIQLVHVKESVECAKRQHAPYEGHWICPACKHAWVHDLADDNYLSHPCTGETCDVHLYCSECAYATVVKVRFDIVLTLAEPETPADLMV